MAPSTGKMIKGPRNSNAKWFRATDPNGRIFTRINLSQFCLSRGLNKGAMAAVAKGKYISGGKPLNVYRGWTIQYI